MAYTPKILERTLDRPNQRINVRVEFSDGTNTFERVLPFPPTVTFDAVKFRLKMLCEELDDAETKTAAVEEGPVDVVNATSPNAVPEAQKTWFRKYQQLKNVNELVKLGVLTGDEPVVTTLKQQVGDNFKPEYLDIF